MAWRGIDRPDPRHPRGRRAHCGEGDRSASTYHRWTSPARPSLCRGRPVLDRCMRLGLVVERTRPLRYQGGLQARQPHHSDQPRRPVGQARRGSTCAWLQARSGMPGAEGQASANAEVVLTAPLTPGRARPSSARAPARTATASMGIRETNRAWGGVCMATPSTVPSPPSTVAQRWSSPAGSAPAATRAATTPTTLVSRVRAQEAVGSGKEVLSRFVEPGSHEPLCRLRARGEQDFPARRSATAEGPRQRRGRRLGRDGHAVRTIHMCASRKFFSYRGNTGITTVLAPSLSRDFAL